MRISLCEALLSFEDQLSQKAQKVVWGEKRTRVKGKGKGVEYPGGVNDLQNEYGG